MQLLDMRAMEGVGKYNIPQRPPVLSHSEQVVKSTARPADNTTCLSSSYSSSILKDWLFNSSYLGTVLVVEVVISSTVDGLNRKTTNHGGNQAAAPSTGGGG